MLARARPCSLTTWRYIAPSARSFTSDRGSTFQRSRMVRQPAVNRSSRRFDSFRWSSRRLSARVPAFARCHAPALRVRTCPCFSKVEHPHRKRSVPVRFRTWALVSSSRKDPTRKFVGSIPTAYSASASSLLHVGEPMVRHSFFVNETPHCGFFTRTKRILLPREYAGPHAHALDGRAPALYAVKIRFDSGRGLLFHLTEQTLHAPKSWFESSHSPRRSGAFLTVNDAQW